MLEQAFRGDLQAEAPALSLHVFKAVAQAALGGGASLPPAAARLPPDRGRDQLQAAHAEDARAPRGPPQRRRRGHNRLEYDQGFLVKLGDGAADVKPIAGLYKTQVCELARHLGVTEEILTRPPTTDTSSLAQSQEDFFFSLPCAALDLLLWAKNHGVTPETAAAELGHSPEQVRRIYDDIDQKRRATAHLHRAPILLEPVAELPGTWHASPFGACGAGGTCRPETEHRPSILPGAAPSQPKERLRSRKQSRVVAPGKPGEGGSMT